MVPPMAGSGRTRGQPGRNPRRDRRRKGVRFAHDEGERAMDEIVNPRTGQRMVFITDTPEVLEIDTVNPPTPVAEPEHVHPRQISGARVIGGVLEFDVAGQRRTLSAGESITIPPGVPHHFWNPGHEDAHAVQWFRPALKSRLFFETLFALAGDGKLDDAGMPGMLQIAAMIPVF